MNDYRIATVYVICETCHQNVPKIYYNGVYRVENHNTPDDSDICIGSGVAIEYDM